MKVLCFDLSKRINYKVYDKFKIVYEDEKRDEHVEN